MELIAALALTKATSTEVVPPVVPADATVGDTAATIHLSGGRERLAARGLARSWEARGLGSADSVAWSVAIDELVATLLRRRRQREMRMPWPLC